MMADRAATPMFPAEALLAGNSNRLLIVDPNIAGLKGHFLELARVIADAACERRWKTTLLTSTSVDAGAASQPHLTILPTFTCRKLRRWSLDIHGYSRVQRDLAGHPAGGGPLRRIQQFCVDRLHGTTPPQALRRTADELSRSLKQLAPSENDLILLSTADDFMLLILAAALQDWDGPAPLNLGLLWHFPIQAGRECERRPAAGRQFQLRLQLERSLSALQRHRVHCMATTQELTRQLNRLLRPGLWQAIDYPIRGDFHTATAATTERVSAAASAGGTAIAVAELADAADAGAVGVRRPLRVVCGGALRSEKGQRELSRVVELLWDDFLARGRIRLGLQIAPTAARRLIPAGRAIPACDALPGEVFDLAEPVLSAEQYGQRIRSADVGLFLYNGRRYYSRCSGVLLELLICGKPVIVPAGSWLSRQIAPLNAAHLERVDRQQPGGRQRLNLPAQGLPTSPRAGLRCSLPASPHDALLTFRLDGVDDQSYLAVEVVRQQTAGQPRAIQHILEVQQGVCRLLLECAGQRSDAAGDEISLRLWSPYGERGIGITEVECKHLAVPGISPAAVGVAYARLADLPDWLAQVEKHHTFLSASAEQNAPRQAAAHNAVTMLQRWVASPLG